MRALAARLGVRPTKTLGQNFVIDANTVRRIVRTAEVGADDHVVEVGPGLGSLTLGLLPEAARVTAVEVDPVLAGELPATVARHAPAYAERLTVVTADALRLETVPGPPPTALVANLPYNISVPVLLHLLERFGSIERVLVMVQSEVADRLAAPPGQPDLRHPVGEGRVVRRGAAGRGGRSHRVLAGAQRRLRAGRADAAGAAGDDGRPGRGVRPRRRGLRAAAQDAAGGAGRLGRVGRGGGDRAARGRPRPEAARRGARRRRLRAAGCAPPLRLT